MHKIEQLIEALQLEPHPEGGFYRSTMRDEEKLQLLRGERPLYTSIYFLLRSQDISHFGSSVEAEDTYGLVGCMVAPGFDFADFELFTQRQLIELYPQHEGIIRKMAFEQI